MMTLSRILPGLFFAVSLLAACGGGGGGGTSTSGGGSVLTARIYGPGTIYTQTAFLNTLDGTASSDPQGLPLTYSWTFQSRPGGSAARIDGADQAKPEFEPDVAGTYVVQLVVSNGTATSLPASQTIVAAGAVTGWKRMGDLLDITYAQNATNPYVAADASGNPVVAWEETDPIAANGKNIYVKRWNGTAWTQLGGALDTKIADDVYQPVVAIDPSDNNPVVIWEEKDGVRKVFVKKWNGAAWTQLGGALNKDIAKDAFPRPSIVTSSSGSIYAAWGEHTPAVPFPNNVSDIIVSLWTGTTWSQLGANMNSNDIDQDPALAVDPANGLPVLAWSETGSFVPGGSMVASKWTGTTWTGIGALFEGSAFNAVNTAIAIGADSLPLVAWNDDTAVSRKVAVKKYSGGTTFGGGYLTPSPGYDSFSPSLLADPADYQPVLGFGAEYIYVKKWDTAAVAWTQYGGRVNYWLSFGAPIIAYGPSGKVIVAWHEDINGNKNIYVKMQQ